MVYPHAMLRLEYLYYSFDNNVALSGPISPGSFLPVTFTWASYNVQVVRALRGGDQEDEVGRTAVLRSEVHPGLTAAEGHGWPDHGRRLGVWDGDPGLHTGSARLPLTGPHAST